MFAQQPAGANHWNVKLDDALENHSVAFIRQAKADAEIPAHVRTDVNVNGWKNGGGFLLEIAVKLRAGLRQPAAVIGSAGKTGSQRAAFVARHPSHFCSKSG